MSEDANKDVAVENPAPETENRSTEAASSDAESNEMPVPAELSAEQVADLKNKAAKADENWDRLVRLTADFENYKKRMARERQDAIRYANESLLEKLIPVLDNFDMALTAAQNPQANTLESLKTGIQMIFNQLKSVVAEAGLEEIDASNKTFDPNWHEAVAQQETSAAPEGQVIQQSRKGYKLRDRLIRPASVVVAKKPAA